MIFLKRYRKFIESVMYQNNIDISESSFVTNDDLLRSIGAEELDMFNVFKLPKADYLNRINLDMLDTNSEFINSLSSIGLKKSSIENSDDYECFIKKSRFMFIYKIESNELENPDYIIFQSWNSILNRWEFPKLLKINVNIRKFYDKISSKTIEVVDGLDKYIYKTSNKNDWDLQNIEKENDIFKTHFNDDDFEKMINDKGLIINIL